MAYITVSDYNCSLYLAICHFNVVLLIKHKIFHKLRTLITLHTNVTSRVFNLFAFFWGGGQSVPFTILAWHSWIWRWIAVFSPLFTAMEPLKFHKSTDQLKTKCTNNSCEQLTSYCLLAMVLKDADISNRTLNKTLTWPHIALSFLFCHNVVPNIPISCHFITTLSFWKWFSSATLVHHVIFQIVVW